MQCFHKLFLLGPFAMLHLARKESSSQNPSNRCQETRPSIGALAKLKVLMGRNSII